MCNFSSWQKIHGGAWWPVWWFPLFVLPLSLTFPHQFAPVIWAQLGTAPLRPSVQVQTSQVARKLFVLVDWEPAGFPFPRKNHTILCHIISYNMCLIYYSLRGPLYKYILLETSRGKWDEWTKLKLHLSNGSCECAWCGVAGCERSIALLNQVSIDWAAVKLAEERKPWKDKSTVYQEQSISYGNEKHHNL